jgi:hypothetical protein
MNGALHISTGIGWGIPADDKGGRIVSVVKKRTGTVSAPSGTASASPRDWPTLAGWIFALALNGGYLVYVALLFANLVP